MKTRYWGRDVHPETRDAVQKVANQAANRSSIALILTVLLAISLAPFATKAQEATTDDQLEESWQQFNDLAQYLRRNGQEQMSPENQRKLEEGARRVGDWLNRTGQQARQWGEGVKEGHRRCTAWTDKLKVSPFLVEGYPKLVVEALLANAQAGGDLGIRSVRVLDELKRLAGPRFAKRGFRPPSDAELPDYVQQVYGRDKRNICGRGPGWAYLLDAKDTLHMGKEMVIILSQTHPMLLAQALAAWQA